MPHAQRTRQAQQAQRTLLALLPCAFGRAGDFVAHGFAQTVRALGLPLDLQPIDAGAARLDRPVSVEQIHAQVVAPARAAGYGAVWLGGVSLGALGAMLYAAEREGDVDGVIAIAPYVGTRDVLADVRAAGGLNRWHARGSAVGAAGWETRLLHWLAQRSTPLIAGWGDADRFADSIELAMATVDEADRLVLPGEHDWTTWRRLWDGMLTRHGARIAPPGARIAEPGHRVTEPSHRIAQPDPRIAEP